VPGPARGDGDQQFRAAVRNERQNQPRLPAGLDLQALFVVAVPEAKLDRAAELAQPQFGRRAGTGGFVNSDELLAVLD
jgi:hypothetical protein